MYNRTIKAKAAEPTVVSGLFLGSWAASASTDARLFINAVSNNMPTTVVDMVWTGAGGSKSQFGEGLLNNGAASGIRSVTYTTDCFYIDIDGTTPFATEGHTIVVPGKKIFTVGGVDYVFDKTYTFTYSNSTWALTSSEEVLDAVIFTDVILGGWAKEHSTANKIYLDVCSNNLPIGPDYVGCGLQLQKDGVTAGGLRIYAVDNASLMAIEGVSAVAGTKLTIPEGASFVYEDRLYKFQTELNLWYNGTSWQSEEYIPTTTVIFDTLVLGAWAKENSTANLLYINLKSSEV